SDSGYIVVAHTCEFGAGGNDIWILKLDADGSIQWQKTYGGAASEGSSTIQRTSDGGYIVAGSTSSFGAGGDDAWLLKLDATGTVTWQKTYGGPGDESFSYIEQTNDGGYIASGYTTSFGLTGLDLWVLKLDASGNIIWQRSYDSGAPEDNARAVHQT